MGSWEDSARGLATPLVASASMPAGSLQQFSVTRIRNYRNPCSSPQGNLLMVITRYDNLLAMYNLTVVTLIV